MTADLDLAHPPMCEPHRVLALGYSRIRLQELLILSVSAHCGSFRQMRTAIGDLVPQIAKEIITAVRAADHQSGSRWLSRLIPPRLVKVLPAGEGIVAWGPGMVT
ncbi:hypothetical protein [Mycobacterium intracellulare]|uniref:hypothetical protein n=1 Tax=Mycobacterium intracellulare TaxID=1767 RepID=UPI001F610429|nr:hypothetical protein [Mycobacterium intracellulare]